MIERKSTALTSHFTVENLVEFSDDLLALILRNLNTEEILKMASICKSLNIFLKKPTLWKPKTEIEFPLAYRSELFRQNKHRLLEPKLNAELKLVDHAIETKRVIEDKENKLKNIDFKRVYINAFQKKYKPIDTDLTPSPKMVTQMNELMEFFKTHKVYSNNIISLSPDVTLLINNEDGDFGYRFYAASVLATIPKEDGVELSITEVISAAEIPSFNIYEDKLYSVTEIDKEYRITTKTDAYEINIYEVQKAEDPTDTEEALIVHNDGSYTIKCSEALERNIKIKFQIAFKSKGKTELKEVERIFGEDVRLKSLTLTPSMMSYQTAEFSMVPFISENNETKETKETTAVNQSALYRIAVQNKNQVLLDSIFKFILEQRKQTLEINDTVFTFNDEDIHEWAIACNQPSSVRNMLVLLDDNNSIKQRCAAIKYGNEVVFNHLMTQDDLKSAPFDLHSIALAVTGGNVNIYKFIIEKVRTTSLDLSKAILRNHTALVEHLVKTLNGSTTELYRNILEYSILHCNITMFELLLNAKKTALFTFFLKSELFENESNVLKFAAQTGFCYFVEALLESAKQFYTKDIDIAGIVKTTLSILIAQGHTATFEYIFNKYKNQYSLSINDIYDYQYLLKTATDNKKIESVHKLIDLGIYILHATSWPHENLINCFTATIEAFHLAVIKGDLILLERLAAIVFRNCPSKEERMTFLNSSKMGSQLLHYAVLNNSIQVLDKLLDIGFNMHEIQKEVKFTHKDGHVIDYTGSPIEAGIKAKIYCQSEKAVIYLLNKAIIPKKSFNIDALLILSIYSSCPNVAQFLLKNGANVNKPNEKGVTPLHAAMKYDNADIVKLLLENGANPNVLEAEVNNAIKNQEIANFTDTLYIIPENMMTSFIYYAAELGQTSVYIDLIKMVRDKNPNPKNKRCREEWTPLHIAAMNGHCDILKAAAAQGITFNVTAKDNTTPLYLAVQEGHAEAVQVMLEEKANPSISVDGVTILMIAIHQSRKESILLDRPRKQIINLLFEYLNEDDLNKQDEDGLTALMYAAKLNDFELIAKLLQRGADPRIVDNDKNNVLDHLTIAAQTPRELSIVENLKKKMFSSASTSSMSSSSQPMIYDNPASFVASGMGKRKANESLKGGAKDKTHKGVGTRPGR